MTVLTEEAPQLQVTWRAQEALDSVGYTAEDLVARHVSGDWGNVSDQDKFHNQQSLNGSGPIVSAYRLNGMTVIWIITSADHRQTVVLLPSDSAVYRKML